MPFGLHSSRPAPSGLCRVVPVFATFFATLSSSDSRHFHRLPRSERQMSDGFIRGEVFFSRFWILCEGQSEVFLLTALFDALALSLDAQGVSLIDYQNNGSSRAFACLARAFGFPWALLADGDEHGRNTLGSLKNAGFSEQELSARVVQLPDDADLEGYVVGSAWRLVAVAVAKEFQAGLADDIDDAALAETLRAHKPLWARRLGDRLRRTPPSVDDLPDAFARLRTIKQSAQHNTRGSLNLEIVGRAIGPDPIDKICCDRQMRERLRILAANIGAKSL